MTSINELNILLQSIANFLLYQRGATALLVAAVKRYHKLSVTVRSNYHTSREHHDSYIHNYLECSQVPNKLRRDAIAVAQAKYCNSFQLTHMPRDNHAQSNASNGDRKEDKTLLQRSQLSQHGEFWHVSVSGRQRSRPCGQNLCGAFVRLHWQPTSKRAIEQWRPTAQQKRLYLHHQGEFQHQNCTVGTVDDSDHEGVVRIFYAVPISRTSYLY